MNESNIPEAEKTVAADSETPETPVSGNDIVNVSFHLREMAKRRPYKRAVVYSVGRDKYGRMAYGHLTFRQLDKESDCLAHGLEAAGIVRGTRTILMVRPSPEFFCLISPCSRWVRFPLWWIRAWA